MNKGKNSLEKVHTHTQIHICTCLYLYTYKNKLVKRRHILKKAKTYPFLLKFLKNTKTSIKTDEMVG